MAESKPSLATRFAHLLGLAVVATAATDPAVQPALAEAVADTNPSPDAPVVAPAPAATAPIVASATRAEDDDESPKRDDESDEDYEKRKKKAKAKAKAEDDPDSEMRGDSPAAQARDRERARCAAIFSHEAAARRPDIAASIAFDTRLTRTEAVAVLVTSATGAPARGTTLAQRMAAEAPTPVALPGEEPQDPNSAQARANAAIAAARAVDTPKK